MIEGKFFLPWPGADDRTVVEEMLRDPTSGQWYECNEFIKKLVQAQAKNIPKDHWEDIVQDAMIRVDKSLHSFKYQCTLKTWLFGIVRSCIIDAYRKIKYAGQFIAPPADPDDDVEREDDAFTTNRAGTVEDECITHEELHEALAALQEYVSTHGNPIRNRRILDIVIFEGRSLEEAATAVGCSAAVVGYVVRSAKRYVREKSRYQQ
ncbi:MAG: RNA polymerase sigma factor [Ktedonobacteraceae bacterium]